MSTEPTIGGKPLSECTREELIVACKATLQMRMEITAERDALRKLLASPFPIHALWKNFAEWAIGTMCVVIFIDIIIKAIKQ